MKAMLVAIHQNDFEVRPVLCSSIEQLKQTLAEMASHLPMGYSHTARGDGLRIDVFHQSKFCWSWQIVPLPQEVP